MAEVIYYFSSRSNKSDAWFDRTIGFIEDIIMGE